MDDGRTFFWEDGGGAERTTGRFSFLSQERIFEKGKKELKNTRFRERGRTREREKKREREREREMRGVVGTRGRGMHNDAGGNFNRRGRCGDAGGDEDEGEDEDVETCPLCCNDMDATDCYLNRASAAIKYARGVGIKSWKLGSARRSGSARRVDRTTTKIC